MLLYLDLSCAEAAARGQLSSWRQLRDAIEHGAVKRLRPKVMTVACMIFGLLPILWSNGAGADVMKRIAVPLVGGIVTSFLMELVVYPPLFAIWKWNWEVQPAIRRAAELSELSEKELDQVTP
jgi:Cu(I)/Ag(I) efflux system membrane protein CusA/SilA